MPSCSMPIVWLLWFAVCAPSTFCPLLIDDSDLLRPSIRNPPRLIVSCCPASIQPLVSMCRSWIQCDTLYAADSE